MVKSNWQSKFDDDDDDEDVDDDDDNDDNEQKFLNSIKIIIDI